MLKKIVSFYDRYHLKNNSYSGVIARNNFTYWYILQTLHQPLLKRLKTFTVLDVGCGVGTLGLYVAQLCKSVVGIDISERAIGIAKQAKQFTNSNNLTFKQTLLKQFENTFDLILCTEVIEHVPNPQQFVELLVKNLQPKGWLLLSTPNRDNWLTRIGYYRKFDQEVGHLRRYSVLEITRLLEQNGFKVKYKKTVEGPLRSLLFTSKLGIVIKLIKGPLIPLFHYIDELVGKLFGSSDIVILAQKHTK